MTDTKETTEKSAEVLMVKDNIAKVEQEITRIDADPVKYADDRIASLDVVIPTLPVRKPTKKGNVTMRDHLVALRAAVAQDKEQYALSRRSELTQSKVALESEKSALELTDGR